MAWFMQQDGIAGIHQSEAYCVTLFVPLLHMQTAHAVFVMEKSYF
jgi:hypothetical protein